jgi:hypothetical protein
VGEDNDLETFVRKYAPQLTQGFLQALANGPGQEERLAADSYARWQLGQMQARLNDLGLPEADAAHIQSLKPDDYAKKAVDDFVLAFRSSALAGLAVAHTPEARAQIEKEAANPDSAFYQVAIALLKQTKPTAPITRQDKR